MREKKSYLLGRTSEEGLKRVGSSVKTVLREKDFQKMEHGVQYHVSMFGVLLEIVNRSVNFLFLPYLDVLDFLLVMRLMA